VSTPAARAPGRLEVRRERFLEEGERLFLSKGYAGASVNEIVRCAGGSLATLYSEFGSKEGLFAEIMRRRAGRVFDYEVVQFGRAKGKHKSRGVRGALVALATRMLDRILSEDSMALYRISIGEGPRFPELRATILEVIFPTFLQHLAAALREAGVATGKDGALIAEEFLSLVHGQLVFRAACGGAEAIATKCRVKHAERAVDAFLVLHPAAQND
jgi:AcrR family transcriptional regulator